MSFFGNSEPLLLIVVLDSTRSSVLYKRPNAPPYRVGALSVDGRRLPVHLLVCVTFLALSRKRKGIGRPRHG